MDDERPSRKKKRTTDDEGRKKKKRRVRESPLSKFRKQTLERKRALLKIVRESNREIRAITRDLGKLKRK